MSTNVLSAKDVTRGQHLIDAKDQILGKVATQVALLLMGKNKPNFVPYLDTSEYVVVINAKQVKVTGKKESTKKYVRHSGYPGGLTVESLRDLRARKSEDIIIHAVKGMIPKTKLGRVMLQKLRVFSGEAASIAKGKK